MCGAAKSAGLGAAKVFLHRFVHASPNVVWMAPISYMLILTPLALVLGIVGHRLAPRRDTLLTIVTIASIGGFSLVLNVPGIHDLAAVLAGAGLGVQTGRIATRDLDRARWVSRRMAAVMGGLTLVLLAASQAAVRLEERRWAARLPAPAPGRPNVLLIVLDTQRAKSMSVYGYSRPTTPNLERLAASGVRFDAAFATAPWTLPSHASIMTGRWVHELSTDWSRPLDGAYPTLAEALSGLGYATAGFTANLVNTSAESGIARGFSHYEDYPVNPGTILRNSQLGRRLSTNETLLRLLGRFSRLGRKMAPEVSAEFLAWLDGQRDRPFFVFLNYFDAHDPYPAPPPFNARFGVPNDRHRPDLAQLRWTGWTMDQVKVEQDAYDASIAYLDEHLGLLFDELERRGQLDRTVVIVTSDHGEEFYEHRLMRHGNSLYRPALNVPLIIRYPAMLPGGTRVAQPVSLRDLPATVLDLIGETGPARFPGRSLRESITGSAGRTDEPILSYVDGEVTQPDWFPVHDGPLKSVLIDTLRYIVDRRGSEEVYGLNDLLEERNLLARPELEDAITRLRQQAATMVRTRVSPR